jgi:hypothetical protein
MPLEFQPLDNLKIHTILQEVMRHLIVEAQATGEVVTEDPDQLMMVITACLDGPMAMHESEQFQTTVPGSRNPSTDALTRLGTGKEK